MPTDRADAHQGPDLQPLRAGLPYTSDDACRELLLGVLSQAVIDDDREWAMSPEFDAMLRLVGLSESAAFVFKIRLLLGALERRKFLVHPMGAVRREVDPESPIFWDSWKRLPQ